VALNEPPGLIVAVTDAEPMEIDTCSPGGMADVAASLPDTLVVWPKVIDCEGVNWLNDGWAIRTLMRAVAEAVV
jgi:hypothetical protein